MAEHPQIINWLSASLRQEVFLQRLAPLTPGKCRELEDIITWATREEAHAQSDSRLDAKIDAKPSDFEDVITWNNECVRQQWA